MWIEILTTYNGPLGQFSKGENRDVPPEVANQLPKKSWRKSCAPWERNVDPLQQQIDAAHANFRRAQQDLIRERQALTDLIVNKDNLVLEIAEIEGVVKKGGKENKNKRLLLERQVRNAEAKFIAAMIELARLDTADLESVVARAQKILESLQKQKGETNDQKPETPKPETKAEGADDPEG